MAEKSEIDREFEEYDRECFAEQVRLYRQLTDEERLARSFAPRARPWKSEEILRRARSFRDRERDEDLEKLAEALNGPSSDG